MLVSVAEHVQTKLCSTSVRRQHLPIWFSRLLKAYGAWWPLPAAGPAPTTQQHTEITSPDNTVATTAASHTTLKGMSGSRETGLYVQNAHQMTWEMNDTTFWHWRRLGWVWLCEGFLGCACCNHVVRNWSILVPKHRLWTPLRFELYTSISDRDRLFIHSEQCLND